MKRNRQRFVTIAVVIAVVSALPLVASDRTMIVEYIRTAEFDHGRGFDATAMEVMGQCVEGTVKKLGLDSQSVVSEMSQVEDSAQLDESLGIGAAASLGYGMFSMSAAAHYARSHSLSTFGLTYSAKSEIESSTLALDAPRLKDEFAKMSYLDFRSKCGDYYVDGITTGGEYIAMVTINTKSSSDKQDISAQVNLALRSVAQVDVAVTFANTMASLATNHEMTIKEIRKGGSGQPIAVDPGSMVENYKNFARSVADNPAPYQVILKKYSALPNYPSFGTSDSWLESALNTLDTLGQLTHKWSQVLNEINTIKAHPEQFRDENLQTLADWENAARGVLTTLAAAIKTCAENHSACSVPNTPDSRQFTDHYPVWKPDAQWARMPATDGDVARDVAVGSKDLVWALFAKTADPQGGFTPKRWDETKHEWTGKDGGLTQIATAADGTTWAVNNVQDVFRWDGIRWPNQSGKLVHISVGSANQVWGVNAAGKAYELTRDGWQDINLTSGVTLAQIELGSDGSMAIRSPSGETLWAAGRNAGWIPISNQRRFVDVAVGDKNTIYVIDNNGDLFRFGGRTDDLGTSLGKFTKVAAAADGTLWAINGQGEIFRLGM